MTNAQLQLQKMTQTKVSQNAKRSGTCRGSVTVDSGGARLRSSANCSSFAGQANQADGEHPVRGVATSWFLRASCYAATVAGKAVFRAACPCAVCSNSRSCETGASLSYHSASWKISIDTQRLCHGRKRAESWQSSRQSDFGRKEASTPFPSTFSVGFSRKRATRGVSCDCTLTFRVLCPLLLLPCFQV